MVLVDLERLLERVRGALGLAEILGDLADLPVRLDDLEVRERVAVVHDERREDPQRLVPLRRADEQVPEPSSAGRYVASSSLGAPSSASALSRLPSFSPT